MIWFTEMKTTFPFLVAIGSFGSTYPGVPGEPGEPGEPGDIEDGEGAGEDEAGEEVGEGTDEDGMADVGVDDGVAELVDSDRPAHIYGLYFYCILIDITWVFQKRIENIKLRLMRGGRPATTISRPRHILIIFTSEPPQNLRPSILMCLKV